MVLINVHLHLQLDKKQKVYEMMYITVFIEVCASKIDFCERADLVVSRRCNFQYAHSPTRSQCIKHSAYKIDQAYFAVWVL